MRGNYRSFRGARRPKSPVMWGASATGWTTLAPTAVAANTLTSLFLLITDTAVSASTPQIARLTVLRIVGDFILGNTNAAAGGSWSAGIIAIANRSGDVSNVPDPSVLGDADQRWMWLRHGFFGLGGATPASTNMQDLPFGGHIDVKVRRILRPSEELLFVFKAQTSTQYTLNLRTLISRTA